MIKYLHSVLNDQFQQGADAVHFEDEGEVLDFVQIMKLEVEGISRGECEISPGQCVEIEMHGDQINGAFVVEKFPSFAEWKCKQCGGTKLDCILCDGNGWDVGGEPNSSGVYVRKIQYGSASMFILVRDETWEEMTEGGHDA
jgi:hypothetical protein